MSAYGLIVDLSQLRHRRGDIPLSWFRRACKRNEVRRSEMKPLLMSLGFIDSFTFPMANLTPKLELATYDAWRRKGRQVQRGEFHVGRSYIEDACLFSNWQTDTPERAALIARGVVAYTTEEPSDGR